LDAIVPFFPLGKQELARIFELQLNLHSKSKSKNSNTHLSLNIHHVTITPAMQQASLRNVEFQTWLDKTTQVELLTFSPDGAVPIVALADKIAVQIANCLEKRASSGHDSSSSSSSRSSSSLYSTGDDEDKDDRRLAVLDYNEEYESGSLLYCPVLGGGDANYDSSDSTLFLPSDCKVICRLSIF
jgi:hypothetical protein